MPSPGRRGCVFPRVTCPELIASVRAAPHALLRDRLRDVA
jgi:hypothetical protein